MGIKLKWKELPRCDKGTCLRIATRYASYGTTGSRLIVQLSCDYHGGTPAYELPYAPQVRAAIEAGSERYELRPYDDGRRL